MSRADEYTYTISYDDRDGIFVGRVAEFKSLAAHGDTAEEGLTEIRFIVDDVIQDLQESREPIPAPQENKPYTGSFLVTVPKSLHRALAEEAAAEGISLNELIVSRLAAGGSSGDGATRPEPSRAPSL